jgi:hypothetical protein
VAITVIKKLQRVAIGRVYRCKRFATTPSWTRSDFVKQRISFCQDRQTATLFSVLDAGGPGDEVNAAGAICCPGGARAGGNCQVNATGATREPGALALARRKGTQVFGG